MARTGGYGLARRFALARTLGGVSARELDTLADRGQGSARLIESGRDALGDGLRAYADVFDISLDWLIAGKGPEPDPEQIKLAIKRARARAEASLQAPAKITVHRDRKRSPSSQDQAPPSSRVPKTKKRSPAKARRRAERKAA